MTQPQAREALLPCPFCGSRAVMSTYYIECAGEKGCHVNPNVDKVNMADEKAIQQWNTRTESEKVKALVDALERIAATPVKLRPSGLPEHPEDVGTYCAGNIAAFALAQYHGGK